MAGQASDTPDGREAVRVLLVDDQPANLLALEAVLDGLGLDLVRAYTGEEALRRLAGRDFAVVLLDVRLPGLSGFETAQRIRAAEGHGQTPIIFLTAFAGDDLSAEEAYALGAVDYLVKPLVPVILRAKVTAFVELYRLRAAERRERRSHLTLQLACARAVAEGATVAEAVPRILQAVGTGLGWDWGAFWAPAGDGTALRAAEVWARPGVGAAAFTQATRDLALARGQGLPGRVWAEGRPTWIADVQTETNFPRLQRAVQEGLRAALGFPVTAGGAVLGVIEFLGRDARAADEETLQVLASIGSQLGQFIQRRRAEEDLRRSRHDLMDFVENAPVGLHWVGPDGTLLWANQAELDLLGYGREEYLGRPVSDFHADPPVIRDILRRLSSREELQGYEARLRCKDGTIKTVLISSNVRWENGQFVHTRCFTRDISERKQAEEDRGRLVEELRRRAHQLEVLARACERVNAVLEAPVILRGLVAAAREVTGAAAGTAGLYRDGALVFTEYDDRGTLLPLDLVFTADQKYGIPSWVLRHRAAYRSADAARDPVIRPDLQRQFGVTTLINLPIWSGQGDLLGCLELHNKAGRRAFDDEDQAALQILAASAAVALENAQLLEQVREAGRRKDEFLSLLAHELRNPLAPVLTGLHILGLKEADRPARDRARAMMDRQVRHLVRLVDDLLDVARITRGAIPVRRERLDLAELVRTTAEDRRPGVEAAGLRLTVAVPPAPVWVAGDAARLAQVLTNLLDNAVKFRADGGRVAVRLTAPAGLGQAVLEVADDGSGITAEMLPRLFDAFAQADRSLDRKGGGLGLGLTLVKGLVELHGGAVQATSDGPGKGATFTVRLPLKEEVPALAPAAEPPSPAAEALNILVVEDHRDAAESLRMLLELLGHRVTVAHTGPEGVAAARALKPDVVLCDIGLPGMDGYGVAGTLRQDPTTARTNLIAITGYGQEADRRRAHQAGFNHHLTKPVDPEALQPLLVRSA